MDIDGFSRLFILLKTNGLDRFPPLSQAIMARSPYLEAKVHRWCLEKRELIIEDCDPVTFNIIVNYMC